MKEMQAEKDHNRGMFSVKKAVLLFVVLYLCFAVIRLPADRVWPEIIKRAGIQNQVLLSNGEGSWLAGTFENAVIFGHDFGSVSWCLKPLYLLTGAIRAGVTVQSNGIEVVGDVNVSPWEAGLYKLNGTLSSDLLNTLGFPGVPLSGEFKLHGVEVSLKKGLPSSSEGRIVWLKAGLKEPYDLTAGNFEALIKTDSEGIKINASDTSGDVMLRAAGTVKPDGNYAINCEIGARESADPDLVSFLKIIGEPGPDGRVKLSYRGKLRKLTK